ncbi:hypothetical protein RHGRI_010027 [Rhododendron griersonianum]|uniref:Uncharacterized protein n=1 Tax=Rhododendron griersonianum TaxID=479676 RepID=A0AAV6KGY7_9ERIC|nr:hypothetical protein RHGRI_010027 [Rhododendron griersonianum]
MLPLPWYCSTRSSLSLSLSLSTIRSVHSDPSGLHRRRCRLRPRRTAAVAGQVPKSKVCSCSCRLEIEIEIKVD